MTPKTTTGDKDMTSAKAQIKELADFLMKHEMVTVEGGAVDVAIHHLGRVKELEAETRRLTTGEIGPRSDHYLYGDKP